MELTPGFPALSTEITTAMAFQICSSGNMAPCRSTAFLGPSNKACLYETGAKACPSIADFPPSGAQLPLRFRRQRLRRPRLQLRANRLILIGETRPIRPFSEVLRFASALPSKERCHSKSTRLKLHSGGHLGAVQALLPESIEGSGREEGSIIGLHTETESPRAVRRYRPILLTSGP